MDGAFQRKRGAYFNWLGNLGEAWQGDLDLVDSVGQAAGIEGALVVRGECVAIVVALADEFNRGFEGNAVGGGNFEAEFSGIALSVDRKSEERKGKNEDAEVS